MVVSKLAGTVACNCADEVKVAGRLTDEPVGDVHQTEAPDWKFEPFAVNPKAPEFCRAVVGVIEVSDGCDAALGSVIKNGCGVERLKSGFKIAIWATPGVASRDEGSVAWSCAELTKLAGNVKDAPDGAVHQT